MPIVDLAIYADGRRTADPTSLDEAFELAGERGGLAWVALDDPDEGELRAVAEEFGVDEPFVGHALALHHRSGLERLGDAMHLVLRPARYDDAAEAVRFDELHVLLREDLVVTVRHGGAPDVAAVRERLEAHPEWLAGGAARVLGALLAQVVEDYAPVVAGLEQDIDEIEEQLFGGDEHVSRRSYELLREVIRFQKSVHPLDDIIGTLAERSREDGAPDAVRRSLRAVAGRVRRVSERADAFSTLLQNALTVHSTLVSQRQNEQMERLSETSVRQAEQSKRISSWAAILFAPTMIAAIYGMNFRFMPELEQPWGYPAALGAMLGVGVLFWAIFKAKKWL